MSMGYAEIYGSLRGGRLAFTSESSNTLNSSVLRVGVFLPSGTSRWTTPSSHVRVLRQLMTYDQQGSIVWTLLTAQRFVENDGGSSDIDIALVQRTAIPPDLSESFIARCESLGVGIVYEIDDDLLSDDPGWRELADYLPHRASIEALLDVARLVTVSTRMLAERFAGSNDRIEVVENRLDRSLWLAPEMAGEPVSAEHRIGSEEHSIRLLFVGGPSHAEDLEIVRPALDLVRESGGRRVVLTVVGGVPLSQEENWFETIDVPDDCRHYPQFVSWVRSIVGDFDVAVAPLADTRLNLSKSDLRFLEYAAMKLPGIYSDVAAFSSVDDRVTGLVVNNTPDEWADAIVTLCDDPALRIEIAKQALSYVMENRLIDGVHGRFGDLLWSASST
jgi:glycosyltransferase involved in cell wall biosynthesis